MKQFIGTTLYPCPLVTRTPPCWSRHIYKYTGTPPSSSPGSRPASRAMWAASARAQDSRTGCLDRGQGRGQHPGVRRGLGRRDGEERFHQDEMRAYSWSFNLFLINSKSKHLYRKLWYTEFIKLKQRAVLFLIQMQQNTCRGYYWLLKMRFVNMNFNNFRIKYGYKSQHL